ncbi:hypothetical protein GDO81_010605 [Engystomops pustulosus]|uniref:Olfactory receptor n=1 Tax=Engystomops pustulosus TaxID=76066 RepID=A0AAV7C198_ENGPU|nr:hypothetical protein GDO81_010605 [Engystomops pustulosus]
MIHVPRCILQYHLNTNAHIFTIITITFHDPLCMLEKQDICMCSALETAYHLVCTMLGPISNFISGPLVSKVDTDCIYVYMRLCICHK